MQFLVCKGMLLFIFSFLFCSTVHTEKFDVSSLGFSHADLSTIQDIVRIEAMDMFTEKCLGGTNHTMHSEINRVRTETQYPNHVSLSGTTIWINEFQAVGHAM